MFPVKCRNMQSHDLHTLKVHTLHLIKNHSASPGNFSLPMPKGSIAGRSYMQKCFRFSMIHHKVRTNPCCIPKDIHNTYDTYLRMYINHIQVPRTQQEREAGSNANSHRAAQQLQVGLLVLKLLSVLTKGFSKLPSIYGL